MSDDRPGAPQPSRRGNFFYLFAALLVLTVVGPVMAVAFGIVGGLFAEVSLSLTLLIALLSDVTALLIASSQSTRLPWREP